MSSSMPEIYRLEKATRYVPNSCLPVLVYRSCLPSPLDEASATKAVEENQWLYGGVFESYFAHHFHSVTHECYAVVSGKSRLLLGRGPQESQEEHGGLEVELEAGDAIVLPVLSLIFDSVANQDLTSQ